MFSPVKLCYNIFIMYLKKLEIKGFKSFFAKTVLDFLPTVDGRNSITAIVGPNGSGKSNISDAIKWVMGEQSYKALRGKKSEDIIFNGSLLKGQLSATEVVLTLDNSDGKVMPDYPEIVITRRLYRSGEGEYLINNHNVRLLDVQLLLAKLQFAQHSYSIISQGTIDRLLTVGALERKDYLDEASGIKEYKIKQHQAQLKLNRTKENISQADALLREVEPRLRLLSKQVKKLEKRQEVSADLTACQEKYFSSIYSANKIELDALISDQSLAENDHEAGNNRLVKIQNELADLARASSRARVFDQLQSEHQMAVQAKNDLERELAVIGGRMQAQYSSAGRTDIGWLENKISDLKSQQAKLDSQISQRAGRLEQIDQEINAFKLELDDKNNLRQEQAQILFSLEKQALNWQAEDDLRQYAGLTAVTAVIENKEKFGVVYGTLAELGAVSDKHALALETAAGAYLSALVVKDDQTARLAIEFLRANRLGYASFLPVNKIKPFNGSNVPNHILQMPGVEGLALQLIKYPADLVDIFSFVLKNTLIVKDLATAQKIGIGQYRMVTLDGDVADKSGVMKGGYRFAKKSMLHFSQKLYSFENGLTNVQSKIKIVKKEISRLDQDLASATNHFNASVSQKESAHANLEVWRQQQNSLLKEISALEQEYALACADPALRQQLSAGMEKQKQDLLKSIQAKQALIDEALARIEKFNQEEETKKRKVFALQDAMQAEQILVNQALAKRNELRVAIARLETKQENIAQEARLQLSSDIVGLVKRLDEIAPEDELARLNERIQKLKYQLSLIGGIDDEVVAEFGATKEKYDFLTGQITDLNKAIIDLEKMIGELDFLMKKKRSGAFKKIRQEFIRYSAILFGGGTADMKEIFGYEDDAKEAPNQESAESALAETEAPAGIRKKTVIGIDISVNPPGKKIHSINSLSGGERTLASIALICAVLSYNPAPFIVLDEVEAALDETNTRRFSQIVSELARLSQFIIITHNRVTMHASDALYGVAMSNDGMSKLLSVKLNGEV